ncbi:isoleucyl-tRNA synthetase [Clavibacter michiganensis]
MTYPRPVPDDPSAPDQVAASPRFPDVEKGILAFWKRDDTFRASVEQREGCDEWVFYDGPPFANGLPHYGHLLTGYAKDAFPRFQTMRGKQVHRRFGWDTHGLPAELEAMRQLGITEKSEIEEMGVEEFNAVARRSVLEYTGEWEDYVTRSARWVDFEDDYKTLDLDFMESVIWAFKELHAKGLAYEGFRVLPYCWHDQTPLSNHELRMDDDVYRMRQDQSVTVTFPLVGAKAESLGLTAVRALAWTTTPWTLPTNMALAVGPDIAYAVVPAGPAGTPDAEAPDSLPRESSVQLAAEVLGSEYLIAQDLVGNYAKDLGYASADEARAAVSRTVLGRQLEGVAYDQLWDFYADTERFGTENAWQVLVADYVTTTDGTGIVHQAPAYGEEDQQVCAAAGIPVILSLDEGGRFVDTVPEVAGELWSDAGRTLTRMLKAQGRLIRQASYEHSYPHCWRCKNPLIYKAVSSWFVRVTDFRDDMVRLNQDIAWTPENVKDGQFGKWIGNARDWSISRNRFWGSPIPVWKSDDPAYPRIDVYGSLDELEADFGVRPTDLHRPFIDRLTRPNPDDPTGKSTMRRIEDVLDVWFDSGSMPFAQVHYPFENREWFDEHSQADFIVEYIGQTRGWFYTLHALSTALFDRPAFSSVVSHGIVLGNDGQKMSKSLRNYPDVNEVFDRDGSDAMRWFLLASPVLRGGNLVVTEEGIREGVRQVLLPLWSTWYFFSLYANSAQPGRLRGIARHDERRRAGPLHPGAHAPPRHRGHGAHDRARLDAGRRRPPRLRRRAHQLVRAPQPRPLLGGHGAGRHARVRHPAHGPRDRDPRGRAAPPARVRAHLEGPHGRSQRAPRGLAGARRPARGRPPRRGDGPGPPGRLHRALAPQAVRPPRAPAARAPHGRERRRRRARPVRGHPARRAQRQGRLGRGADPHERGGRGHHAPPHRQRARRRAPPRQGRAAGDPGRPTGRLERGRRRGRRGRRAARGRRVRARPGGRGRPRRPGARAAARRRLPAARHRSHAGARGRGPRARRRPERAGRAEGRWPRRERPHLARDPAGRRGRRAGGAVPRPHRP